MLTRRFSNGVARSDRDRQMTTLRHRGLVVLFTVLVSGLVATPHAGAAATFELAWGSTDPLDRAYGMGTDAAGSLYVADSGRNRIVKYDQAGEVLERFHGDETFGYSQGLYPTDVAVAPNGEMYVADLFRVMQLDSDGNFIREWSQYGQSVEGNAEDFVFAPGSIALDSAGNVYVADAHTARHRIQVFDSEGNFLREWGERGSELAEFQRPAGLAFDAQDHLYVTDSGNNRVQVFDDQGALLDYWGQSGNADGRFQGPLGIEVDANGDVYVADNANFRVQKFASDGTFLAKWGVQGEGNGEFTSPTDVAALGGAIFVSDSASVPLSRVQKFDATGSFILSWGGKRDGDGQLDSPHGMATDGAGNVYVADTLNDQVQKFDADGNFISRWGESGTGDAQFNEPVGLTLGPNDHVYVIDRQNYRIQEFDDGGAFVRAWGSYGGLPGEFSFPAPGYRFPGGIDTDSAGNVYVSDSNNGRIQKFDENGVYLDEWAPTGDDYPAPYGLAIDSADNIYVSVAGFGGPRIEKFDSAGISLTEWGSAGAGNSQFASGAVALAVNHQGQVLAADTHNLRIQKFDSDGGFLEKFGAYGLDDGEFVEPLALATGAGDDVYVADAGVNRISKFTVDDTIPPPAPPADLVVDPTSPAGDLTPRVSGVAESGTQVRVYGTPGCSGVPLATGSASAFSSQGIEVTVASGSTTTFRATATNLVDDVTSACSTDSVSYKHVPPPAAPSNLTVTPASPGATQNPFIKGNAPPGTTVKLYSDATCTSYDTEGSATDFANPGIQVSVAPGSTTTFRATATSAEEIESACSTSSVTYEHQADLPPSTPTGLATIPTSPNSSQTPSVTGTADPGTNIEIFDTPGCTGEPIVFGDAEEFADTGIEVFVEEGSTTTFRAKSTNPDNEISSPCSTSSVTYVNVPPTAPAAPTNLDVSPASPGTSLTPSITGTAPPGTDVEIYDSVGCSGFPVGFGSAAEFAAGIEVEEIEEGTTHVYRATAYDPESGLESACSTDSVTYTHATGACATDPALCPDVSDIELSGKSSIKARKKRKLKLIVTNSGGGPAHSVVIGLASSNSKVKVKPKQLTIETIGADSTETVSVLAKAKRSARGTALIKATSGDLSAEHELKVKKKKK